jgi:threonine synthase
MKRCLVSTISGKEYPFHSLNEFTETGESLEIKLSGLSGAKVRTGNTIWERFSDFLPFKYRSEDSLGEGHTPLLSSSQLSEFVGIDSLLLKNETLNPTWSFKDRGSLTCSLMAQEMGERVLATISTGNMGVSIAAYGTRARLRSIVFIPTYCPKEKIQAMAIHGATIFKVEAPDYGSMKRQILQLADSLKLRIVSGNGPIRVEGYKACAFELYEQCGSPDFIAVPTSACGHIRGIFKGFRELLEAGLISRLPRMIIVQAMRNSPLVSAFKQEKKKPIPFTNIQTVASAITTGDPPGGEEILHKAYHYNWLAEEVSEEEILESQRLLGRAGFFVEPSSATSLSAIKKLVHAGKIKKHESVVMVLTGSGLKDTEVFKHHPISLINSSIDTIEKDVRAYL